MDVATTPDDISPVTDSHKKAARRPPIPESWKTELPPVPDYVSLPDDAIGTPMVELSNGEVAVGGCDRVDPAKPSPGRWQDFHKRACEGTFVEIKDKPGRLLMVLRAPTRALRDRGRLAPLSGSANLLIMEDRGANPTHFATFLAIVYTAHHQFPTLSTSLTADYTGLEISFDLVLSEIYHVTRS